MQYWKMLGQVFIVGCLSLALGCGGSGSDKSQGLKNYTGQSSSSGVQIQTAPQEQSSSISSSTNAVTISGLISFDRVLFEGRSYRGLDYSKTQINPARNVVVQALNGQDTVLSSTVTDAAGHYSLQVNRNADVRIRVLAQLEDPNGSQWSIQVRDNTNGKALYVLDGSLASSGTGLTQERDLHAASGWDGEAYSETRSAAPFAILDTLYDAVALVVDAEPSVILPPLNVYWSTKNIAISGDTSKGNIGTSYYTSSGPAIYLLGAANNDSDEYDRAVIQHEFGHYIEHQLARTESLGGSHNQNSRLDIRVAFGEAWGNAFAGMASGDPIYRDSFGASQSLAFAINVERRGFGYQGWYSENSIQAILYDLFDNEDDGGDSIALGFKPILDTITSDDYLNFDGFASIYPFIDTLQKQQPALAAEIRSLVNSYSIFGEGGYAEGETNDGGSAVALPLYQALALDQTINLCSDADYQDYNGMDIRRFVRMQLSTSRTYSFSAVKSSGGLAQSNPQMRIFRQGNEVASILNGTANSEQGDRYLQAGTYILEVYEEANVDGNTDNSGLACFDVTVH